MHLCNAFIFMMNLLITQGQCGPGSQCGPGGQGCPGGQSGPSDQVCQNS